MLGEFGFTTHARIVRVFSLLCRRNDRCRPLMVAVTRRRIGPAAGV
jgi:hypothetical protein